MPENEGEDVSQGLRVDMALEEGKNSHGLWNNCRYGLK